MKRPAFRAAAPCAALLLAWPAAPVAAHRLDETLQATLLTLDAGRLDAALRIVPGALVAGPAIAAIDTDGDGRFSTAEQAAAADRAVAALQVTVDGATVQPRLAAWEVPAPDAMRAGLGELRIAWWVPLPREAGRHRVELRSRADDGATVHLVNALVPRDPALHVLAQQRDARQAVYALDMSIGPDAAPAGAPQAPTPPTWPHRESDGMRGPDAGAARLLVLVLALGGVAPWLWRLRRRRAGMALAIVTVAALALAAWEWLALA